MSMTLPRRALSTPKHYAYVKISEGCDLPCTFCVIPKIRAITEAGPWKIRAGSRALGLPGSPGALPGGAGQHLVRLGPLRPAPDRGADGALAGWKAEWIRLHYLYPSRVTDELIRMMAEHPRISPYFDVPLQHASDRILRSMKRIGGRDLLDKLIERIRTRIPRASIRSTFIVGYPGERTGLCGTDGFPEILGMDYVGFFT